MKKFKLKMAFAIMIMLSCGVFAQEEWQDVLYLSNGSVVRGVIVEHQSEKTVKIQTDDGNLFIYSADEVEKITKEEARHSVLMYPKELSEMSKEDFCRAGRQDAALNYQGDGSLVGLTWGVSLLTGPVPGLLPPIAVSSTSLNDQELNYPSQSLWQNADYKGCYTEKAEKIRRKKAWTAYGLSSGAHTLAVITFFSMVIGVVIGSISSGS